MSKRPKRIAVGFCENCGHPTLLHSVWIGDERLEHSGSCDGCYKADASLGIATYELVESDEANKPGKG